MCVGVGVGVDDGGGGGGGMSDDTGVRNGTGHYANNSLAKICVTSVHHNDDDDEYYVADEYGQLMEPVLTGSEEAAMVAV